MRETAIMNAIRMALSARGVVLRLNNGVWATPDGRRVSSGLPPGTSDLLFVGHGFVAFIEVKTEAGRLRPEQAHFLREMARLGHRTGVARSVEDALKITEEEQENG
jgi:hypothetical protein